MKKEKVLRIAEILLRLDVIFAYFHLLNLHCFDIDLLTACNEILSSCVSVTR